MADPATISLVSVGSVVIAEGVKFLYGQAAELLKRMRERSKQEDSAAREAAVLPTRVALPPAIPGEAFAVDVRVEDIEMLRPDLEYLLDHFSGFERGFKDLDLEDEATLKHVAALRKAVETLLGRQFTFSNEARPRMPTMATRIVADEVHGALTAIRAKTITAGNASVDLKIGILGKDGTAIGIDVDNFGNTPAQQP